ncbi:hypothetical protein NAF17_05380 [Mucilaginibacter sp. RB4R14]|uniref:hypothetical protein n=1 Tax=Mucilaginibacter aurantiaciroseus TaxID=2949308 RepID=UPI0020917E7D|nr:hypothetical protein [Mucilaginibacter aurantiaciroseus]MCO5934961.1 hypothetical protein [Mucilaginibacter aurantiaciroseus]
MADEDTTGKDRDENGYASYANVDARHFDAEFSSISKSGIGVFICWFNYVMPDIYDRACAYDKAKWDFNKFTPELVVVNLFQNYSWLSKAKVTNNLKSFLAITRQRPNLSLAITRHS